MPIHRRLPKRGFNNPFRKKFSIVNINRIQEFIDLGKIDKTKPINNEVILESGIINKTNDGIRLLAKGEIKDKIEIHVNGASKKAISLIENLGGKVILPVSKDKTKEQD